ncbi:MAG: hypothetical protein JWL86_1927 [Rhizobium sp.]|nr:hypothetical protein [Rhizobium sp.]
MAKLWIGRGSILMSTEFWLGLFLSIPLGIITSLWTPWIQRKIEQRGKRKNVEQAKYLKSEFENVQYYVENKIEFSHYLMYAAIRTTLIGSLIGIFSGILFAVAQLFMFTGRSMHFPSDLLELIQNALFFFGQLLALVGSIMIVNTCRPALSLWSKVRNFDEYKSRVLPKLK